MNKVIFEVPVSIAMEFAGWQTTYANVGGFATASFFAPSDANFSGEFGDVFVIFGVGPKFDLGAGFFFQDFTNYGDGWCNVSPRAAPDY